MGGGSRNRYDDVDRYVVGLVRYKVRRLIGRAGFVEADVEDLEQQLVIDALARLARFDPSRAKRETFASRVVDHHIATLIESRKAGVRDYRMEAGSLDERRVDENGDVGELPPVLTSPAQSRGTVDSAQRDQDAAALVADVRRHLAQLPPDDRELCECLMTSRVAEVSRETGVPRGTLYGRLDAVRKQFEKAGLAAYLSSPDTLRRGPVSNQRQGRERPRSSRRRG